MRPKHKTTPIKTTTMRQTTEGPSDNKTSKNVWKKTSHADPQKKTAPKKQLSKRGGNIGKTLGRRQTFSLHPYIINIKKWRVKNSHQVHTEWSRRREKCRRRRTTGNQPPGNNHQGNNRWTTDNQPPGNNHIRKQRRRTAVTTGRRRRWRQTEQWR